MFFKRIEMHGFKSFAEPVIIEFDRGITCVVGPNGSGKSNISDAIRWVLGEQSPRLLRGGKMEDVIFAGTASRRSRGMAEVTLVIDNSSKFLPVDFSEVAITRRMYRSGESEYAINNNACRMRDIRELLADTGIGVDGYSLIGQGKISEIISNKKDSIREIFEETAGVVGYKTKKSEAERKLEATFSNMERVQDIILEIESRIGSLEDESKRAKEYLNLRDRYKELEVNITVKNIEDIEEKSLIFREDLSEIEGDIKSLTGEKEKAESETVRMKDDIQNMEADLDEKMLSLARLDEDLNSKAGENTIGRERLRAIENNRFRINRELLELREKLTAELDNISELAREQSHLQKKYEEDFSDFDRMEDEEAVGNEKIEQLEHELEKEKQDMFSLNNSRNILINERLGLENFAKVVEKDYRDVSGEQERQNSENIRRELKEANIDYEGAKAEIGRLRKEIDRQKEHLADFVRRYDEKQVEKRKIIVETEKLFTRKKTLEGLEEGYEGYNYGVKFVMNRNVGGIEDVVANLIDVPKGMEKAIETALGSSLQNIVCKDETVAKKSIRLLKEKKAGRVTFLPLTTVKGRDEFGDDRIENVEGFVGYGENTVKFDRKYEKVMSYLLGGTVIAETIDSAIEMQKISKKYRYITLEGDVVSGAGAMSGGAYKNKGNNVLERKKEINQLGCDIEKLSESLEKIDGYCADLQGKIETTETVLSGKNEELDRLNDVENRLRNQLESLEIKCEIALKEDEKRSRNLADLRENRKKTADDIVEKNIEIEKIELKIDELEKGLEKRSEFLKALKEEHRAKIQQMVDMRIKANQVRNEISSIGNLVERNREIARDIEENLEDKEKQLENLRIDEEGIKEGIVSRNREVTSLTMRKNSLNHDINVEKSKVAERKKAYEKNLERREEVLNKLNQLAGRKYELDLRLAKFDTQLENLKNKIWDEFEISYQEAVELRDDDISISSAIKENREVKSKIKSLGDINIGAIKEYDEVKTRYEFLKEQRKDIQLSISQLEDIIGEMDDIIKERFKNSFDSIGEYFEEIFTEFFGGGSAKLEIDNIEDPMNSTIDITAQPPGKQLRNINLLSGGEKTMTAIALMFAVLKTKPTPCCILDEVEAALDDNNIHIFANYLKKFENIQFTLITHQKTTMEHADVMYGVTMPERGISKIFSLNMGDELPAG